MSQATRAIALQEAVKALTKDGNAEDPSAVLTYAAKFEAWMNESDAGDASGNSAGEAPAAPARRGRPAKAATGTASEAATTADAASENTENLKQEVAQALSAAVKVDRDAAVAVLGKYGAQSFSALKAKDYAKALKDLTALLPDPALA